MSSAVLLGVEFRSKVLLGFGVAVLAICGTGLGLGVYYGVRYVDFIPASHETEAAAVAYRKAGLPWEAKDIAPSPPVSEGENAAPLLEATFNAFDKKTFDNEKEALRSHLDSGEVKDARTRLERYRAALALAAKAAEKSRVDYHRDWDCGPELLFPELAKTKSIVQALCLRAEVRAMTNDSRGAAEDIIVARKLARLSGQEPTVISMLVRIASEVIVLNSARNCACSLADDPAGLDRIADAIRETSDPPNFASALRGEAFMNLTAMRNITYFGRNDHADERGEPTIPLDPSKLQRTGLPEGTMQRAVTTRFLQAWTELKPFMDQYQNDPEQLSIKCGEVSRRLEARPGLSNVLLNTLFPSFTDAGRAVVTLHANYQVSEAFVSALKWRKASGRDPSRIEDVPGRWTDPFSGELLRFKIQPGGFRIYSVGRDRKDDGGIAQHEIKGMGHPGFDIVASYPPIKRR